MYSTTPQSQQTFQALWRLEKIILESLEFDKVVQKIVDSTVLELGYLELGYEIVVLCLINEETQTLERISVSQTERAKEALSQLQTLGTPFHSIVIPLQEKENSLIQAVDKNEPSVINDWYEILRPVFTPEESRKIQSTLGIKSSLVFPVQTSKKSIGVIIFSMSKDESEMAPDEMDLMRSFTDIVGLAVQNATVYSSLEKTKTKLEQANAELQKLDKLKDEFLSMASHELKSPMNAVKNYLWMALHKGKEHPEKVDDYLSIAYESIQRLVALVNDLLDVSRIESGRISIDIQPIDLKKIIDETLQIYAPQAAAKNVNLTTQVTSELLVHGDDQKLREVLNNLVSNSIKYTPSGSITISLEERENVVRINITDTGMGICEDDKAKLFQKFSRVGTSFREMGAIEGTGLGLYICKQFIEMMKGRIGVDSEFGKGSTFWFELPKASSTPAVS